MAKGSKRPVLDEAKKHELLAMLSVGCSRRVAAAYVGCSTSAIRSAARRDRKFAEALAHAENQSEIVYLQNIRRAGVQEKYWRAAAWALERGNPQDFAPQPPNTMRVEEAIELVREIAVVVSEEVDVALHRKRVLKRVAAIMKSLGLPLDEVAFDDNGPPADEGP